MLLRSLFPPSHILFRVPDLIVFETLFGWPRHLRVGGSRCDDSLRRRHAMVGDVKILGTAGTWNRSAARGVPYSVADIKVMPSCDGRRFCRDCDIVCHGFPLLWSPPVVKAMIVW